MASLSKIDERIAAAQRSVASLADSRNETIEAIDQLAEEITALQAKDELTAEEQTALDAAIEKERKLNADLTAKGDEIRYAEANVAELQKQREARVEQNRIEASLRNSNRQTATADADPVPGSGAEGSNIRVLEATDEQKQQDITAWVRAHYASRHHNAPVASVLAGDVGEQYANERMLAAVTTTSDPAILPPNYRPNLIEFLYPATVFRRMEGLNTVPLPNGRLEMPRQNVAGSASYPGEQGNIGSTNPGTDNVILTAKKLTALVPASGEIFRRADPSSDTLIRNDLRKAVGTKEDITFIRSDGSSNSPKGLRQFAIDASTAIVANATASIQNATNDIGSLILSVEESNASMLNPYFLMAPALKRYLMDLRDGNGNMAFPEVARGELRGYPYLVSNQIPRNLAAAHDTTARANSTELYFLDASEAILGDTETMELNVSMEAAYLDGSNVRAAFSEDTVVFRIIVEHDLQMRHNTSVAMLDGITWQNG